MTDSHHIIYMTIYGSKLYGTNVATSDTDYRGVYLPDPARLITKIEKDSSISSIKQTEQGCMDYEYYSLQKYLQLLAEGQSGAFDMLFAVTAPQNEVLSDANSMFKRYIWERRHDFFSRDMIRFVHYARGQARKNGLRKVNYLELKEAAAIWNALPDTMTILELAKGDMSAYCSEHIFYQEDGVRSCLKLFGKSLSADWEVLAVKRMLQREMGKYGDRIVDAGEYDTKAMMHVFRSCIELKELIETDELVFPLQKAEYLLSIRQGKLPWKECFDACDKLIGETEAALNKSRWPEHCAVDTSQIILDIYRESGALDKLISDSSIISER